MERFALGLRLAESLGGAEGEIPSLKSVGPGEPGSSGATLIREREPQVFQRALVKAIRGSGPVFLGDPGWGDRELAQLAEQLAAREVACDASGDRGWLCVPTGGSSGRLKFARHDGLTLAAAVAGFCAHFGVERVNAMGGLPLHHVSGLMGWLRCGLTGGKYVAVEGARWEMGVLPLIKNGREEAWFISLVPTQLKRLLGRPEGAAWLRQFRAVLVGGGACWPDLLAEARAEAVPLAITYGMTETAAMVAALRPKKFLSGRGGCGEELPHAGIVVAEDGGIWVEATSLFRGYWPEVREEGRWSTGDLGRWEGRSLVVTGRQDALINSGGEKVNPAEVEAVLIGTGRFEAVVVLGVPDPVWGERVVAAYPAQADVLDGEAIGRELISQLASYKRPKGYYALDNWPWLGTGKTNREAVKRLVFEVISKQ